MNKEQMKLRTRQFALDIMKLVRALPRDMAAKILAHQLLRSATSVGANYRAACRGRSSAEFAAKLGVVLEEADESAYWLELILHDGMLSREQVLPLVNEAGELCAIIYATVRTVKEAAKLPPSKRPPSPQ